MGSAQAPHRATALPMPCRQPVQPAASTKIAAGGISASPTWATVADEPSTIPATTTRRQLTAGRQSKIAIPATISASNQVPGMIVCSFWS